MTATQRRLTVDTLAAMLDLIEDGITQAKDGGDASLAVKEVTTLGIVCLSQIPKPERAMAATA